MPFCLESIKVAEISPGIVGRGTMSSLPKNISFALFEANDSMAIMAEDSEMIIEIIEITRLIFMITSKEKTLHRWNASYV